MKKILYLVMVGWFLLSIGAVRAAYTAPQNPEIIPQPVGKAVAGKSLTIRVDVAEGFARVVYVRLYFRRPPENDFRYINMVKGTGAYVGTIAGEFILEPVLQYFFVVLYDNNVVVTFPQLEPYTKPEEVAVQKATAPVAATGRSERNSQAVKAPNNPSRTPAQEFRTQPAGNILILSPEPDETVSQNEVVIAVSFFGMNQPIDTTAVIFHIDGMNVSRMVKTSAILASYTSNQLAPGQHSVQVSVKDRRGNTVGSASWSFLVVRSEEGQTPSAPQVDKFSARIFSDFRHENVSARTEDLLMLGGNFSGQVGPLRYSGRGTFSSLESDQAQPRNRYQLSVTLPWLGVSLGDNYPRFNNLMLWGKRVRGLESYLHLGFINVDFAMGESNRAVEGDLTKHRFGTFRQNVLAIRPSIGGGKNFQFGITLVKVKDDTASIKHGYAPKDNVVIGPDLLLAFDRHRIEFRVFSAFSLLTNNTKGGPITSAEIEDAIGSSLPFDPAAVESYLIINDSMQPIDPTQLTSTAYDAQLQLRYFSNTMRLGYKRIGSEYQSLANPYLRKDLKGVYFSDRLRLFQNRVYLQFGYENYDDNFSQEDGRPITKLSVLEYSAGFYPGATYPRLYFHLRNYYRDNRLAVLDTALVYDEYTDEFVDLPVDERENNLNQDLSLQLAYNIPAFQARHDLSVGYLTSNRMDRRTNLLVNAMNPSTDLSAIVQMISVRSVFDNLPLTTLISFATNRNDALGGASKLQFTLFNIGAEYALLQNKLSLFTDLYTNSASGKTKVTVPTPSGPNSSTFYQDFTRTVFRIGGLYRITSTHFILLDWNIIKFADSGVDNLGHSNPSFTDQMLRLRYEKRF